MKNPSVSFLLAISFCIPFLKTHAELDWETDGESFLSKYCYSCHGEDKQKGDLRLDKLEYDLENGETLDILYFVLDQIHYKAASQYK